MKYVTFFNGLKMPLVGLGTAQPDSAEEMEKAMDEALKAGYRHFDTAFLYRTEATIGKVLKRWLDSGKVKREELFITTKLPPIAMRPKKVEEYIKKSLKELQLDYVDLYLVHMPVGMKYFSDDDPFPIHDGVPVIDAYTDLECIWKSMENQVDAGRAKSIGVSNFNHKQIDRILKVGRIRPANVQVELHAYFQQKPLREYCLKNNITVTSYASIGSPGMKIVYEKMGLVREDFPNIIDNPVVNEIAKKLNKSTVQVLLRLLVQQNIIVIPKSTNADRLKKNFQLFDFELSEEDMKTLIALDQGHPKGRIFDWADLKGFDEHPEFPYKEPY